MTLGRRTLLIAATGLAVGGVRLLAEAAPRPGPPGPDHDLHRLGPEPAPSGQQASADLLEAKRGRRPETSGQASPVVGLPRALPLRLDIPAIAVHRAVVPVGLAEDGTIVVPPLRADAPVGWYRYLASPGEVGPAVIVGHVDSAREGPAAFYRLGQLAPGDTVAVTRDDGRTATFTVTRAARYPKADFPTAEVYGETSSPTLRLITCGGSFDAARGEYRDNVVVYADLTG